MTRTFSHHNKESGNVLIYVIGALFLMGLLIVILKGSTQPSQNIDAETAILKASQIRQYGAELERGINYILQNGHSESEIRFAYPNHSSSYGDISTDTPMTRQVFHEDGGGVTWRDNDPGIQSADTDWIFSSANAVNQVGSTCTSSSCTDIVAFLPNLNSAVCVAINDSLNIPNTSNTPDQLDADVDITTIFSSSYTYADTLTDATFDGKDEGCFEGAGTPAAGTYHYYKVLLAR